MLKIQFEKPQLKIVEEVEKLLKKDGRKKKKEEQKPWTHKERVLVGAILFLTLLGSIYFWVKGQGGLPSFSFPKFEVGETVILEE